MTWQATIYSLPFAVAAVVSLAQARVAWRYRERRAATAVAVLFVVMTGWAAAAAVQYGFTSKSPQLFWYSVESSLASTVAPLWLVFALTYAGYKRHHNWRVLGLLAVEPLCYTALLWTNESHHLVWKEVGFAAEATPPNLVIAFGPGELAHTAYAYLLVTAGVFVLIKVFWESSAIYRRQTGLLVFGASIPFLASVAFTLGYSPTAFAHVELTPVTFAVSGVVFSVALFRFDLLNLMPVARAQLISTLGNGLLVVNTENRILHLNETAGRIVPSAAVGMNACSLLDVDDVTELDGEERLVFEGDSRRYYDAHVSSITGFRDTVVGHLVAFQEVTDRKQSEQRLEVANRLLRHNLRNDTTKLMGWAALIEEATTDESVRTNARKIQRLSKDLGNLSREARLIETTLYASGERSEVDVVDLLRGVLNDLEMEWSGVEVSLSAPNAAVVQTQRRELLANALENVVENGIEHNDAETPRVEVTVERGEGGEYVVEISDNGPGIPEIERKTLTSGTETPLQHSQGLGLWLAYWVVTESGGSIDFEEREPRGSIVRIRLPAA